MFWPEAPGVSWDAHHKRRKRDLANKLRGRVVTSGRSGPFTGSTQPLDTLGLAAVGLCSNKATDEQIAKLSRFARKTANRRIVLLPDNDPEGEEGFKELLWRLSQCDGIKVKLG